MTIKKKGKLIMKTNDFTLILAQKALGVTISNSIYWDEEVLQAEFTENLRNRLRLYASNDAVRNFMGEDDKNIDDIIDILVNNNMESAYKLFDDLRRTVTAEDSTVYYNLILSLFMDKHKKITFLTYCYVKDTELDADIDLYNSNAIFNSIYKNNQIVELFEREYLNILVLSPDERDLFDDMIAAILKVKQNPGLLMENFE